MKNPNQPNINNFLSWDVKSWSKCIYFWEKNVDWDKINTCLEIGGRDGGLSLWLAAKNKNVICSDVKNTEATASKLHQKFKTTKITYKDIVATNIPFENKFELIIFKSIIVGIGYGDNYNNQKETFNQIHKALAPGGILLFAENLKGSKIHQIARKKFTNWGSDWRYLSLNEMNNFLNNFNKYTIKTTGFLSVFGRGKFFNSLFYTIDKNLLNKIIPKKYKYISYGIAYKK